MWREPTRLDFAAILGQNVWEDYCKLCDATIEQLRRSQIIADQPRDTIIAGMGKDRLQM